MKNNTNKWLIGSVLTLVIGIWASTQFQSTPGPDLANDADINLGQSDTPQTIANNTPMEMHSPTSSTSTRLSIENMPGSSLINELFPKNDPAWAWAKVDIEALKQATPDNLYWLLGAPSQDQAVLDERKEIKAHWDAVYGKVLSNTASEEEIRAYYDHQHKVSTDYVVFATELLNRHAKDLPEEAYGLQTLARNLHLARLEELPGKISSALQNRQQHLQEKSAWLADKEAYRAKLSEEREAALRALGKI